MDPQTDDLKYEIAFYEGVLEKAPLFIDALTALGNAYTQTGEYEKGLRIDKRLEVLLPDDPIVLYNLACSYSLLGYLDDALLTIKRSVKCGYDDFDHMSSDPDLENLRQDERFNDFFSSVKKGPSGDDNVIE
jgi:tetratricopeptide (TPR) repeat protein